METIPPALAEAYSLLRADIYRFLDETEFLAQFEYWDEKELELVRRTIPDLTTIIRGLVVEHESSDTTGKCDMCNVTYPCQVTQSIRALIKDPQRVFWRILDHVRDK
jgi:hypothetical protein